MFIAVLLAIAAEITAFWVVAGQIGFLSALLLLIVVSAFGPFFVRRVGFGILAHTQERLRRGETPTRELFDGLVVLIGGVMIVIPGFIGDALGLLLMIGPVRHLVIRLFSHRMARRLQQTGTGRWQVVNVRARPKPDDHDLPSLSRPVDRPPGPDDFTGI
ncbi:MAG TPA: FxsA family protein [Acidimicrobiales bacterium]